MTHDEIKQFIADRTREGNNLSRIQDMLAEQGVKMTFMELRLIASEIETSFWQKSEPAPEPAPEEKAPAAPADAPAEEDGFPGEDAAGQAPQQEPAQEAPAGDAGEAAPRGRTSVTVDQLQRPGFLATGTVTFGSGASGNWCLDQMGRVMFEKLNGKPDRIDIQEFQMELQRVFAN